MKKMLAVILMAAMMVSPSAAALEMAAGKQRKVKIPLQLPVESSEEASEETSR